MQAIGTKAKVVKALVECQVTLLIGEQAWLLLMNETFQGNWDLLYAACPWATAFQSRNFVLSWYQTYRSKFAPIIITGEKDGKLTGLLTLTLATHHLGTAAKNQRAVIMAAGEYEAEYQTWITEAPGDETFITAAMQQVHQHLPHADVHLRFIPAHVPVQWTTSSSWKKHCVLQPHKRPLMNISESEIEKITRKSEFRNKYNRLKKLGDVSFERITDQQQFAATLQELIVFFDFRQGAMFNLNQFMHEPLKQEFLLQLFEKNLLHVTVLKVNGQILAAVIAIDGGKWVHLGGINIHAPFNAKFLSPGFIHFNLLTKQLALEGKAIFDLTPGGDPYKERFANAHDQVYELVVTHNFLYRVKRLLRKQYYRYLIKANKWPMGIELSFQKKLYFLKATLWKAKDTGISRQVKDRIKGLAQKPENRLYLAAVPLLTEITHLPVQKNTLSDLLQFQEESTSVTRWEFLSNAMHRFEVGQHAYTYCKNGKLLCCVWVTEGAANVKKSLPTTSTPKECTALLQGFYVHTDAQSQFSSFIAQVVDHVVDNKTQHAVCAYLNRNEIKLAKVMERIGFAMQATNLTS